MRTPLEQLEYSRRHFQGRVDRVVDGNFVARLGLSMSEWLFERHRDRVVEVTFKVYYDVWDRVDA